MTLALEERGGICRNKFGRPILFYSFKYLQNGEFLVATISSVRNTAVTLLAGAALAASASFISTGTAQAAPGQLCNVNQNTWVRDAPWGSVMYTIPAGGGFRWVANYDANWAYGHGNGQADGYIPNDGRIYNCH